MSQRGDHVVDDVVDHPLTQHEAVAVLQQAADAMAPGVPAALIATHMNQSMLRNWQAMAQHEPAYAAATTFCHAMADERPHAVLENTPWRHVRTMSQVRCCVDVCPYDVKQNMYVCGQAMM